MVGVIGGRVTASALLFAQNGRTTVLEQLEPATRVKVLAALVGLLVLGFGLVLLILLAGRATRRYMNSGAKPGPSTPPDTDWTKRPLHPK